MEPAQLQELLSTQGVNVRDVLSKLVNHIDPIKARENFGPGFYYGPKLPVPMMQQQQQNRNNNPMQAMLTTMAMAAAQNLQRGQAGMPGGGVMAPGNNMMATFAAAAAAAAAHQQQQQQVGDGHVCSRRALSGLFSGHLSHSHLVAPDPAHGVPGGHRQVSGPWWRGVKHRGANS